MPPVAAGRNAVFGMVLLSCSLFCTNCLKLGILRFFFDFFTQLFTIVKYSYERTLQTLCKKQFQLQCF